MVFGELFPNFWGFFLTLLTFLLDYAAYIVERNVDILFSSSLSVGEFAEVFKGLFEDSIVAVKILKVCCECVDFCCNLIGFGFDAKETFDSFLLNKYR